MSVVSLVRFLCFVFVLGTFVFMFRVQFHNMFPALQENAEGAVWAQLGERRRGRVGKETETVLPYSGEPIRVAQG